MFICDKIVCLRYDKLVYSREDCLVKTSADALSSHLLADETTRYGFEQLPVIMTSQSLMDLIGQY